MAESSEAGTSIDGDDLQAKKTNKIQVSYNKKPLYFYVNLAERYLQQYGEVELSGLGMAISTLVTIAQILKKNQLAVEKRIETSIADFNDESRDRIVQKPKINITLLKSSQFDELMGSVVTDYDDEDLNHYEEVD